MKSLNSSSVDAGGAGAGVGSGPSVGVSESRVNDELSEPASLGVTLSSAGPSVGGAGGTPWLLGTAGARRGCLPRAITREEDSGAERCKLSIPERFPNGLTEPLGKSF